MTEVLIAHTADLDPRALRAARDLLDGVFSGEFTDDDWDHALGGMHALVWEGAELIGHASLVQRRLLHRGRTLRTAYVEGVGVRADRRRHGYAAAMMAELERIARGGYDLAALSSSGEAVPFYEVRGWKQWRGKTYALTPDGLRRTEEEDDSVYVLPFAYPIDLSGELTCDWRDGDLW